ncbi:MAG: acyl-CoA desaturase, partial [Proteobacteria bacterium]
MKKISYKKSIPFFAVHLAAIAGAIFYPPTWGLVTLCVSFYYLRMFGVTGAYHRYFSHRTYKTSRVMQFLLAFLAQTSAQKGALWWAANHRHHHKHSDDEHDIHSPVQDGFWWSHVGWILSEKYDETDWSLISDLKKYPELVFLNRFNLVPAVLLAVAIFFVGGMPALVWGFFISTVLCWHGTFTINSLSHVFGTRRYTTTDTSRNNWLLAIVTMGEGWHNNHHAYQ